MPPRTANSVHKKKLSSRTTKKTSAVIGGNDAVIYSTPPEYKVTIEGGTFATMNVSLLEGQAILSDGGALAYMREGVDRGTLKNTGGVRAVLGRSLAGESAFTAKYSALPGFDDEARTVSFAAGIPGDIVRLDLAPREKYFLSRGAYLASSPDVRITGKLNPLGILSIGQQEGFVLPNVINDSDTQAGIVWISGYGQSKRHDLLAGQSMVVDNGLFLACSGTTLYKLVKIGRTFTSAFFSNEGLGMKFTGPCTLWTQSHNFLDLVQEIHSRLPKD